MADKITTDPAQTSSDTKSEDTKSGPTHYSPDAPDAAIESRGGVGDAGRSAVGPHPDGPVHPLKGPRFKGRPPGGPHSPGVGYIYVLTAMVLIIGAGTLLSGGFIPVDPNGPGGPPTLDPYFDAASYGEQKKIFPSNAERGPDENLQLKTFGVNVCGQKTAVNFLIDRSGSMQDDGKIGKTQAALKAITKKLTVNSVIGMQTFSHDAREDVPISKYGDVKDLVAKRIDELKPDRETKTRDGFNLAKQKLAEVISSKKYPDYKYVLIFMSDGVPELRPEDNPTCIFKQYDPAFDYDRCFSIEQDPRVPTNLAQDIKGLGVEIYSIGIYSQTSIDKLFIPHLSKLLKEVASSPENYHESIEGNNLDTILNKVLNNVCEEQGNIAQPSPIR